MVQISLPGVARPGARFRLSLKDNKTDEALKVELIDSPVYWVERRVLRLAWVGKWSRFVCLPGGDTTL